ncbi:MAG: DnaJ family domain-containing protein, partial [Nocardioidaceae bacterium]
LPGAGKPIPGLGGTHDPDWWAKRLIEREELTGLMPPALALRKEDAALEARLDRETTEGGVRRILTDFNHRVVEARRQLLGGPPVVTPTRDVEQEVSAWRARIDERRATQRRRLDEAARTPAPGRPRWLSRLRRRTRDSSDT